mgnify:CR=1 FL=1
MFTEEEKANFGKVTESLKKYRRAELSEENGRNLIQELYVDLLPDNQILNICKNPNTTYLIGRKGTGKSTIFQKLEDDIKKDNSKITCYIDVKTLFESTQSEYINDTRLKNNIPKEIISKYLLQRAFIKDVLHIIVQSVDEKYNLFERIFQSFKNNELKNKINTLLQKVDNNECLEKIEIPVLSDVQTKISNDIEKESESNTSGNISSNFSATPSVNSSLLSSDSMRQRTADMWCQEFGSIFVQIFKIKDYLSELKEILLILQIRHLYILLDDFSELEQDALKTFVDTILAPLNNWSEEFIKFKIACYPNRIYYGNIDPTKIDKINLDFYNLYSTIDREKMEEKAIDFTKRLLQNRFHFFCHKEPSFYFDTNLASIDNYYELLFQVSMNVPRCLGYIPFYCHQNTISYNKKVTKKDIEGAAQRYYQNQLEVFFDNKTHSLCTFEEKLSVIQQKTLLEIMIKRMKEIRQKIIKGEYKGKSYQENKTNPFTSHFYCFPELENLISTLELNFFITKYNEMSDRDGKNVDIYAINYGLIMKSNLRWGKPIEHRKYFIERPFNFNQTIEDFLKQSKNFECTNNNCKKKFPYEMKPMLEFTYMKCPDCHSPVIMVTIADLFKQEIENIKNPDNLPDIEYQILSTLFNSYQKGCNVKDLIEELDLSKQLIGVRAKNLEELGLVTRTRSENGRFIKITNKAIDQYFDRTN